MFESVVNDIKNEFRNGNMVSKIIIVNVFIFIAINLFGIIIFLSGGGQANFQSSPTYTSFIEFFCISTNWWHNLTHPWAFITSQFLHEGFNHILWNMVFLFWFGRIVGDFIGNQRVLPLYLLGGLVGITTYLIAGMIGLGGIGAYMMGASAGVMAIVMAAGVIAPDYNIRLLLIGDVKLKYLVLVLLFLDLIGIASFTNSGGHFAHLGGAAFGWLYVKQLRNGIDMANPLNQFFNTLNDLYLQATGKARPKVVFRNTKKEDNYERPQNQKTENEQQRLDEILDKIKMKGYESLSAEEKEFLFRASKK